MRRSSASIRSMGGGGSDRVRRRVMPRRRSSTADQATPGIRLVDHHDTAQIQDRPVLILLEPLEARLQLLNAFQLEFSEQGDACALTFGGDIKLDRHLFKAFRPSRGFRAEGEG
jgi:hypothetical protein